MRQRNVAEIEKNIYESILFFVKKNLICRDDPNPVFTWIIYAEEIIQKITQKCIILYFRPKFYVG